MINFILKISKRSVAHVICPLVSLQLNTIKLIAQHLSNSQVDSLNFVFISSILIDYHWDTFSCSSQFERAHLEPFGKLTGKENYQISNLKAINDHKTVKSGAEDDHQMIIKGNNFAFMSI